jgi:hypothetical protein
VAHSKPILSDGTFISSFKKQGTFRSLMHNLMSNYETNEYTTMEKQYTQSLRSSLASLKDVTKAKLDAANLSPPQVWDFRDKVREKALHYTRQSSESRERLQLLMRKKDQEKVQSKTKVFLERIIQERNTTTRKRKMREEKEYLQADIEMSKTRSGMLKGSQDIE